MPLQPADARAPAPTPAPTPAGRSRPPLLEAAVVAVALVVMLAWTYGTWADPIIDFGRELYMAWRLADGQVLYRDVAALNGPLSQYWNAGWFRLLGVSLRTAETANLIVLVALLALALRAVRRQGGRAAATIAGLTVVLVFACGQYLPIANYNWLCPYSHELTHGIVLSLAVLAVLGGGDRLSPARAAAAGLVLGLVFLTKGEVFLAALAAASVALALDPRATASRARIATAAALGFALPPVVAYLLLWTAMPARAALGGTLGTLAHFTVGETVGQAYYLRITGLDDPGRSLLRIVLWSLGGAAFLAPGVLLRRVATPVAIGVAATAGTGAAVWLWPRIDWSAAASGLPVLLAAALVAAIAAWRRAPEGAARALSTERLALLVFALALLAKLGLRPRVWHYGFALALPASLCAVMILFAWVPRRLASRGGHAAAWRVLAAVGWVAFVAAHLRLTGQYVGQKTVQVGAGRDAFFADARGAVVEQAVAALRDEPATATLVAVPEGAMLNFLARRPSTVPYQYFIPHALAVWDERSMVAALAERPPSLVAVVARSTREFGAAEFGRDYARRIGGWLDAHYETSAVFGGAGAATRIELRRPARTP